jgi:hypothetical protein
MMLGYGDAWLLGLAGMRQANTSIAWKKIEFAPPASVVGNLTSAKFEYRTPRGWAGATWTLHQDGTLDYDVTVPVGSTGLVFFEKGEVTEGGRKLSSHSDVLALEQQGAGMTVVMIGSGSYSFVAAGYR